MRERALSQYCGVSPSFTVYLWLFFFFPSSLQRCIINNTHRLMELCVTKLSQDWFPLLELLAMATNPHCKFHIYNGTRPSETVPAGVQLAEDELFARPPDPRSPKVRVCLFFFKVLSIFFYFFLTEWIHQDLHCMYFLCLSAGLVGGFNKQIWHIKRVSNSAWSIHEWSSSERSDHCCTHKVREL